ncbi:hypothetical protein Hanom_Chr07g00628871 [Helianthus anomalus]
MGRVFGSIVVNSSGQRVNGFVPSRIWCVSGVVDQLRTNAYLPSKLRSIGLYHLELAVWEAGVVMGRDTWNLNTGLMVYVHIFYETLNK